MRATSFKIVLLAALVLAALPTCRTAPTPPAAHAGRLCFAVAAVVVGFVYRRPRGK